MRFLIAAAFLVLARAQSTIDPAVLAGIFGTPPTPTPNYGGPTTQRLEDVTQRTRMNALPSLPTLKPSVLLEIFGTPPPRTDRLGNEDITVRPTEGPTMHTDENGQSCQCVPYYLCDANHVGVDVNNASVTGWGVLDIRFGEDDNQRQCQESVEVCCSVPKDPADVPKPDPKPQPGHEVGCGYRNPNGLGGITITGNTGGETQFGEFPWVVAVLSQNGSYAGVGVLIHPRVVMTAAHIAFKFGTSLIQNLKIRAGEWDTQTTKEIYPYQERTITVRPTEGPTMHTDENGQSCQCVPYYLCDANHVGVDVNNASVTGWGVLDIRFGEDDNQRQCQESVEVCCSVPKDPADVPKPDPKPQPGHEVGCGYRNPNGLGGITITGNTGGETQFGEFPWVVAVLSQNGSYAGVGVLIHPRVVMTAAHIAFKFGTSLIQNLKIRAGEWDTQTTKEIYPYQERTVQDYYIHENFMPKSLKNDIALLLLETPVEISQHVNVICMPEQDEVFDSHKNCVANGWGKSHFELHDRYAVILKKVEVDMVPHSRCNALLKRTRLGHNFQLHRTFVCAGGEEGKDTCQGDGGAPLACPIGNNRYKLTGLVAWGIGCGQQDVPAVYVNVPIFRSWVDDKMARWGLEATSYRISNMD
uniref:Phenoloxidase-activating factor 2 n=1 Tax=Heliothis virescens TaxID=7102 RepID=A0A2A4K804_HELVI